jgi:hypothetical protein
VEGNSAWVPVRGTTLRSLVVGDGIVWTVGEELDFGMELCCGVRNVTWFGTRVVWVVLGDVVRGVVGDVVRGWCMREEKSKECRMSYKETVL